MGGCGWAARLDLGSRQLSFGVRFRSMESPQDEFLRVVLADLDYLDSNWSAGDVTDDEMRRNSTLLRRFLIDGDLLRAWIEVVGKVPYAVPSKGLKQPLAKAVRGVAYTTVSTVTQPGSQVHQAHVIRGPLGKGPDPVVVVQEKPLKLKKFVNGFCVVIDDVFIRRREVIQFVANKAGGAHYDEDKTKPYQRSVEAMTSFEVMGRDALYYELLGIGQALASAPDTTRLVEELQQRLA